MARRKKQGMAVRDEILDELLSSYETPEDLIGKDGILAQLKKALIERALGAEMTAHLGYTKGDSKPDGVSTQRHGTTPKTVQTEDGPVQIEVPRDRENTFEPLLVKKHQRRLNGFDMRVLGLYARGMTVREIQGWLKEQYGADVSPDLISSITDAVVDEIKEWQNRPLERMYPVVFFDALRVKIRDEGHVKNKAVYLALGILADGTKDILGLWIEQSEGAKFWLKVMTELKNRGLNDILIAVVDGLKGFPDAITAVFPQTQVQTCIVHLIRGWLEFCAWQDRKHVTSELKAIYQAPTMEAAAKALDEFAASDWGKKYPNIAPMWRRAWEQVIPFLAYPPEVRKVIYTTNALESVNMRLRKIIKNRGHFPNDDAAIKLLYLAIRNITKDWTMPPREWRSAMNQFAILFGDRFILTNA
jgi:putative transposase